MQKIAIGADHKGFSHKSAIIEHLTKKGFEVIDVGPFNEESVDYPDYAFPVAKKVVQKEVDAGILICYTGIGMSIAANKVKGVRASLVDRVEDAILTREHNDSNVLCMSAKNLSIASAIEIVDAYLKASFAGERHLNRVNKLLKIEQGKYE